MPQSPVKLPVPELLDVQKVSDGADLVRELVAEVNALEMSGLDKLTTLTNARDSLNKAVMILTEMLKRHEPQTMH